MIIDQSDKKRNTYVLKDLFALRVEFRRPGGTSAGEYLRSGERRTVWRNNETIRISLLFHWNDDDGSYGFDCGRLEGGSGCTFVHMDWKYNNGTDYGAERLQLHCAIVFLLVIRRDSSTSVYPEGRYPSHHLFIFSCHIDARREPF